MKTHSRLSLLTLALTATAVMVGMANPAVASDERGQTVVLSDLKPDVTIEQMNAQAEKILGERLPGPVSQSTVVSSDRELTAEQIETLAAGKDAEGVKRLGDVWEPDPASSLEEMARQIRVEDVLVWECVVVIIWGEVWLFCRPLVIRA